MTLTSHLNRSIWRAVLQQRLSIWVIVLLLIASISFKVAGPLVFKQAIDFVLAGGTVRDIQQAAMTFIGFAVSFQLVHFGQVWLTERVTWRVMNRWREAVIMHVLQQRHQSETPTEMVERIEGDVTIVTRFISQAVQQWFGNGLFIVSVIVILAVNNMALSGLLLFFMMMTSLLLYRLKDIAVTDWLKARTASTSLFSFLASALQAKEELPPKHGIAFVLQRFDALTRTVMFHEQTAFVKGRSLWPAMVAVTGGSTVCLFALGHYFIDHQWLTVGTLYLAYAYLEMVATPLEQVAVSLQQYQKAVAAWRRVKALDRIDEQKGGLAQELTGPLTVEFVQVAFSYGKQPIIESLSFRLERGEIVALVGPSGSGKSTIRRLLCRQLHHTSGSILLNGLSIEQFSAGQLADLIAVVPQVPHIWTATIRDNLTLFKECDEARLWAALEHVTLAAKVRSWPDGLQTLVTAVTLSAGERQLLALARLWLRSPQLIILDEATSLIDEQTEKQVFAALKRLTATMLVISHRPIAVRTITLQRSVVSC